MKKDIVYLDNAATTYPKPKQVLSAMQRFMVRTSGSPGRSGHRLSLDAGRVMLDARTALAALFGVADPLRIVLTKNATEALNIAVCGLLKPGDHAVTSSMEHNSLMRPLRAMEARGVALSIVPCSPEGLLDPADVIRVIRADTKALFLTHASNVTGTIMPIAEVGRIARERGLIFCVDAAQTAGVLPIDVEAKQIDLLAFTGHKSLFGPQGTGGLYIRPGLERKIAPVMTGGTGSRSEFEQQPDFMPDRYEAGTPNTVGYAGLEAAVRYVMGRGVEKIRAHEQKLTRLFLEGLEDIDVEKVYGLKDPARQVAVVSFRLRGADPAETALALDERFRILCRPGLHCAPSAHRTIGSFPSGTVRFSFGYFNTVRHVRAALKAVKQLSAGISPPRRQNNLRRKR
ncbi:MAG: aminotransferase class V-fold PLP-dependent enzyme [Syntrophales bacterium]|jgi:cysteine desulfurase family protein|nr:aminotransferase class V-fold PLP-dependent enzyme [Syntrophales bacterium]